MGLNYRNLKDLAIVTPEDLEIVEQRAKALSVQECLEYLCLDQEELTEAEASYIRRAHRKGVADGIYKAVDYMFRNMQMKNGGQACLDYLKTRSEPFQVDATPRSSGGFSFNVVMDK